MQALFRAPSASYGRSMPPHILAAVSMICLSVRAKAQSVPFAADLELPDRGFLPVGGQALPPAQRFRMGYASPRAG